MALVDAFNNLDDASKGINYLDISGCNLTDNSAKVIAESKVF
jgi:hypothetical protein